MLYVLVNHFLSRYVPIRETVQYIAFWRYVCSVVTKHTGFKIICHQARWKPYIQRLIDCSLFQVTSRSRIFHLYGDVTIADEGLQNLGLCSALKAFEQEGIFIVPHLLWHGASVFPVSSKGTPHSVASYDTRGDVEDLYSNPDPHGATTFKEYMFFNTDFVCLLIYWFKYVPLKPVYM
jgi:hypothetical protein